jgi:CNT family concentrative nucleoside transporter
VESVISLAISSIIVRQARTPLDPRSRLIMLYAMCGFANFGSLGIMIAGLSTMCPEKRDEVVSLGLKSIVSGTLTTCLLGAIVGMLTPGIG